MLKFWYISYKSVVGDRGIFEAAKQLNVEIEMYLCDHADLEMLREEELAELVKKLEAAGPDAVICRGRMAPYLKALGLNPRILLIPVQFLGSSTFSLVADVLRHHPEALPPSGAKAAVFSHRPILIDKETMQFLFHLDLVNIELKRGDEAYIRQELLRVKKQGIHFILAGKSTCRLAGELGIPAFYSDNAKEYESLYYTLKLAIMLVESSRSQREHREALEYMMDYSFEGILQLNLTGQICFCNSVAREMLEPGTGLINGKSIWDFIPELGQEALGHVLEEGENIYGTILKIRDHVVIVNVIPYIKNGGIQGAIVHMSQKEELEKLETKLKMGSYSKGLTAKYRFPDIKGDSEVIRECRYKAKQFAKHYANVLLLGESGTGKELFAQSIHNYSMREKQPFVAVNCGALPMNLLESELFGYVGGAFTGASRNGKRGLIEQADKGTIFLDEISEMDIQGQIRLLRVLEERVIMKIGDDRVIPVDVRIIAASNKNLMKLVQEGKFREDLYYRLNVLTLRIPPLRKRGRDILLLAEEFLKKYGMLAEKKLNLTPAAEELLLSYEWPGNVRQLRNFCERLTIISNKREIDRDMVYSQLEEVCETTIPEKEEAGRRAEPINAQSLSPGEREECQRIVEALNICGGSRTEAANRLGMGRSSLWRKMKKYGIEEKAF